MKRYLSNGPITRGGRSSVDTYHFLRIAYPPSIHMVEVGAFLFLQRDPGPSFVYGFLCLKSGYICINCGQRQRNYKWSSMRKSYHPRPRAVMWIKVGNLAWRGERILGRQSYRCPLHAIVNARGNGKEDRLMRTL